VPISASEKPVSASEKLFKHINVFINLTMHPKLAKIGQKAKGA